MNFNPHQTPLGRFFAWPGTRLGWWSVGLAAEFIIMLIVFIIMPLNLVPPTVPISLVQWQWRQAVLHSIVTFSMLCGVASGVTGLIAIARQQERSWLVWLTILPGLLALFLLILPII